MGGYKGRVYDGATTLGSVAPFLLVGSDMVPSHDIDLWGFRRPAHWQTKTKSVSRNRSPICDERWLATGSFFRAGILFRNVGNVELEERSSEPAVWVARIGVYPVCRRRVRGFGSRQGVSGEFVRSIHLLS